MKTFGTRYRAGWAALASLLFVAHLPVVAGVGALEDFPEVERIWMGLEEGTIRPSAYKQERALMDGYLSLIAKDGQLLKKGDTWAILDPEELDMERRSLTLEEEKLERKVQKDAEDADEAHLRLSLEIHEAEGKRQTLQDSLEDPSLPAELGGRIRDAIRKMDERLELLRKKADPETLKKDMELGKAEGELLLARKRKQFLAMEKRAHLLAGFDGELRLSDSLKESVADRKEPGDMIWVAANELLATLVDDEEFEIVVRATGPVLSQVKREDLLVFLQEPTTGSLIAGDYSRTDEIDNGSEIIQQYIFTIRENSVGDARHSSGQRGLVHVYRKFGTPVRLVQKKAIAFAETDALSSAGWNGVVTSLWPGSTVVQVGPQTIAVRPKDDN